MRRKIPPKLRSAVVQYFNSSCALFRHCVDATVAAVVVIQQCDQIVEFVKCFGDKFFIEKLPNVWQI